MEIAIQAEGLSKRFGNLIALAALNLEVRRGEVLGYLGPNGAGKTVTIRLLLGMLHPSAGQAQIFGCDVRRCAPQVHRRLAYVGGETNLWPGLTGEETLHLLGRVQSRVDADYRDELIERFALDPSKRVRQLLQGQSAEGRVDRGLDEPSGSAGTRRAVDRTGPADGARVPRLRGRSENERADGVSFLAHSQ